MRLVGWLKREAERGNFSVSEAKAEAIARGATFPVVKRVEHAVRLATAPRHREEIR